jgi:hypothetical protein
MFLGFKSKAERQREIEHGAGKPPSACTVDELKARYEAQQTELIENSKKVYEEVWKHSSLVNAARMVKDEMRKRGVDPSDAGYCEYSEMIEWFGDKVRAFDAEMDRIRQSDKPWGIPNLKDIVREAAIHDANSLYAFIWRSRNPHG